MLLLDFFLFLLIVERDEGERIVVKIEYIMLVDGF